MRSKQADHQVSGLGEVTGARQRLPAAGVAAKCGRVGVAAGLSEAGDGIDRVVTSHLDEQVLAVGLDRGLVVAGQRGKLALEVVTPRSIARSTSSSRVGVARLSGSAVSQAKASNSSRCASLMRLGRPGRGVSRKPSMPSCTRHVRQCETV
jgi:hypothetical protein